jgi:hypothetical protein
VVAGQSRVLRAYMKSAEMIPREAELSYRAAGSGIWQACRALASVRCANPELTSAKYYARANAMNRRQTVSCVVV